ncbi:hypothetical protein MKQ70_14365 [Chitinophaga sedimenti]|uniref:hypothetical protein n=1 Tax=Chitinophaga sedimenti TaxID=2033606 RepID=UPI002002AA08|nr:hypothetical protein [Chitinophaga sedimenti]MCK7556136.1 hypothetical protein [Chitinophaga sedimenti]
MKKTLLIFGVALASSGAVNAQSNNPIYFWGPGLTGYPLQLGAITAENSTSSGLTIEGPQDGAGAKLPLRLSWRGGGMPGLFIGGNSRVGMGTENPGVRLHLVGEGGLLSENGPLNARTASGAPDPNIDNPLTSIIGYNGLMSNDGSYYYWRAFWGHSVDLRAGGIRDGQRNNFRIRRFDGGTSWTDLFRVEENGNVGIGTSATSDYKLAVNGTIGAKKVKVTVTGWPDYVFEPGYQLPAIPQLEAFIKQDKHLPGIPTAAEIEENGVDVGEMNKKLLQKVEELTLYLIEENKQLQAQQVTIKSQQERIAALEKKINQ